MSTTQVAEAKVWWFRHMPTHKSKHMSERVSTTQAEEADKYYRLAIGVDRAITI